MPNPTADYIVSIIIGALLLISSYPAHSWCLLIIGAALGLRAILTSEIAGYKSNMKAPDDPMSRDGGQ